MFSMLPMHNTCIHYFFTCILVACSGGWSCIKGGRRAAGDETRCQEEAWHQARLGKGKLDLHMLVLVGARYVVGTRSCYCNYSKVHAYSTAQDSQGGGLRYYCLDLLFFAVCFPQITLTALQATQTQTKAIKVIRKGSRDSSTSPPCIERSVDWTSHTSTTTTATATTTTKPSRASGPPSECAWTSRYLSDASMHL